MTAYAICHMTDDGQHMTGADSRPSKHAIRSAAPVVCPVCHLSVGPWSVSRPVLPSGISVFFFFFFRCVAPRRRLCAVRSLAHTGSQYRSDNPSPYPADGLIRTYRWSTSASGRVARQIACLSSLLPIAHCLLATACLPTGLLLFASTTRDSPAIGPVLMD